MISDPERLCGNTGSFFFCEPKISYIIGLGSIVDNWSQQDQIFCNGGINMNNYATMRREHREQVATSDPNPLNELFERPKQEL